MVAWLKFMNFVVKKSSYNFYHLLLFLHAAKAIGGHSEIGP